MPLTSPGRRRHRVRHAPWFICGPVEADCLQHVAPCVHAFSRNPSIVHAARDVHAIRARMRPIFFNNQSPEEVLRAMQVAPRREPKVVLSRTLVSEIRTVLAVAGPHEDTVLLLRPEHVRKKASPSFLRRCLRVLGSVLL